MFLWFGRKKKIEEAKKAQEAEEARKAEEAKKAQEAEIAEKLEAEKKAAAKPVPATKKEEEVKKNPVKPAVKKTVVTTKEVGEDKPVSKKENTKTDAPKAVAEETSEGEIDEESEEAKKSYGRVYHISKRSADGKWQVKFGGSDKVIKTFETQAKAIAYTKDLGSRQNHGYIIHKTDGKIRKLKY